MALSIYALARGGCSAFGGWYDARENAVRFAALEDEAQPLTMTFPSALSSVSKTENGITSTTPSVSGSAFTATLTEVDSGGYVDFLATLSSGEIRRVRVSSDATGAPCDYCC